MAKSLYDKYGGFAAINKVVLSFYDRVLDSDDTAPYFETIEMSRLVDHQTKFLAALLGGPASFSDEHLRHVHAALGITDTAFDDIKTMLHAALTEHGFVAADAGAVIDEIERRRRLIVSQ
ncbi:MAG: truncated hemoglobin [Reyranellaceae bacterium]